MKTEGENAALANSTGFKAQCTAWLRKGSRICSARSLVVLLTMFFASVKIGRCADQTDPLLATRAIDGHSVSFYEVPLACPAAPQIGCGTASKPLLLELERSDVVSQAWLNRAGTRIAIVWTDRSKRRQRSKLASSIFKERGLKPKELTGHENQEAMASFKSGSNWYHSSDVDRLSEEEAGVIANRWIGRFREKIALPDEKAAALREAFTTQLKRHLTGEISREEARAEMLKIARQKLDDKDVAILLEAFGSGFRPTN